ncbi:MAG TPA: hypothetical protein VNT25_02740 [Allosphingosinicella sp.]|nr:hypothetical protein [Allosphingosinicella sp.]
MLPATEQRVPAHTSRPVNEKIRRDTEERVAACAQRPERVGERLSELEREWDIERALEANAAAIGFIGVVLAAIVDPWFLLIPAIVTAFLFQHALQGWCPPVPILRRLDFRTAREIDEERVALKALRGDFRGTEASAGSALAAAAD